MEDKNPKAVGAAAGTGRSGGGAGRTYVCDGESELVLDWPDGSSWLMFEGQRPESRPALYKAINKRLVPHLKRGAEPPRYRLGRTGELVVDPRRTPAPGSEA